MMAVKLLLTSSTLGIVDFGNVRDLTSGKIDVGHNGADEAMKAG